MALLSLVLAARVNYTAKDRYTAWGFGFYAGYPNPYVRGPGSGFHYQVFRRFIGRWRERQTRKLDAHR